MPAPHYLDMVEKTMLMFLIKLSQTHRNPKRLLTEAPSLLPHGFLVPVVHGVLIWMGQGLQFARLIPL